MQAQVLLVEDDADQLKSMVQRLQDELEYQVMTAESVEKGMELFAQFATSLDLVIADMRFGADNLEGGLEMVNYVRENQSDYVPVIVLTAFGSMDNAVKCMEAGAFSYVFKGGEGDSTFQTLRLTISRALDLRRAARIERLQWDGMVLAICAMVDSHEPYTGGHCERVGYYAKIVAAKKKLSGSEQIIAWRAGLVHDLAKVGIDAEVLARAAKLSSVLMASIYAHPAEGYQMLMNVKANPDVAMAVLEHHKRIDGSGYPKSHDALSGKLSTIGQILGLVDSFDAMTTPRPYMGGKGRDTFAEALKTL